MPAHVIDLCSDDEDIPQPFSESRVGVVSSGINSSNAQDFGSDYEGDPFNKRYVVDVIDGVEIYQFESEVEMEFHVNHETQAKRDELFLGFDIKNQPSKVLVEFFNKSRMKEPWLASHFIPSDTKRVRAATATPPLCSTESSVTENSVREEDVVPLPIILCRNCGMCRKTKFPSIPKVICLDSDEEEDKADKKLEVADDTPSKTFETSGERSFLVVNEHCSQSSEHSYAVTQNESNLPKFSKKNKNDLNTISTSVTSFISDEIICLDSDDDISPVKVTSTKNRSNKKHMNYFTSESTTIPTLNAPTSLKTVKIEETIGCLGNDDIRSNTSVHSERSSEIQTDLSSASYSCTLFVEADEMICLDDDNDSRCSVEMNTINASSNSTLNPGYEKCIDHLPETVCKSETLFCVSEVPHKEFMSVSRPKGNVQSDATVYSKIPFQDDEIICLDDDNDSRYPVEMNPSSNNMLNPGYEKCIDYLPETVCKCETTLFSGCEVSHKEIMSVSRPKGNVQSDETVYSEIPFQDDEIICLDDDNDSVEINTMNASSNSTLNPGYEKCIDHLPETVRKSEATLFSGCEVPHKEITSVSQQKGNVQSDATVYSKIPFQDDEIICLDDDNDSRYPVEMNTISTSSNSTLNPDYEKCIDHLPETVRKSEATLFCVSEVPHKEFMSVPRPKGNVQSDATVYSKIPFQDDEIICLDDDSDSRYPVEMNTINASSNSKLNPSYEKCINHLPETVCKSEATLFSVREVPHKEIMSVSRPKGYVQSDAAVYSKFPDELLSTTSLFAALSLDDNTGYAGSLRVSNTKTVGDFTLGRGFHKNIDLEPKVMCNFVALPSGIPNDPVSQTLNQSELEDIVGLMQDAVSFVCRQEEIANIPVLLEPHDENYSANSSPGQNLPPCSKEYCTMGCVCYCIRRKFKRKRCENQNCIFGCICCNALKPRRTVSQRFHAKYEVTFSASSQWIPLKHRDDSFESNNNENKSAGVNESLRQKSKYIIPSKRSRRKQPLTHKELSSQDYIVLKPNLTKYDVATQPIKTTSVPLVRQIVQQSLLNSNSHFMKKKFRSDPFIFRKSLKNNTVFLELPFSTTQDFKKSPVQTHQQGSDSQHTSPTTTSTRPSSWTDGPPPAFALTCMTPGIGYIALEEFSPSILKVCDPFDPSFSRHFTSVSLATDWLNCRLRENLEFDDGVVLKWFMANSIMLQRKKIKRFDSNVLLDPRCRITKNGVLFV